MNKVSTIKDRIKYLAEKQESTLEDFFKSIGQTSANFRGDKLLRPINSDVIDKIVSIIPDVNLHWLITGQEKKAEYLFSETNDDYVKICNICIEKDKLIAQLNTQIEELKQDKQDLKQIFGLKKN